MDTLIEDEEIRNVVAKLETIKARKDKNWEYFTFYFYAILACNLILDLDQIILTTREFNRGNYPKTLDGFNLKEDLPLIGQYLIVNASDCLLYYAIYQMYKLITKDGGKGASRKQFLLALAVITLHMVGNYFAILTGWVIKKPWV